MNYPTELDGAKVVLNTSNSASNQYGIVPVINDINEIIDEASITAIAICKYDGSEDWYVFACSVNWEVIGDLVYGTLEEARKSAEEYYEVKDSDWLIMQS